MADALDLLAKQRVISASAELEAQLSVTTGARPIVEIVRFLRDDAAEALKKLVVANLFTHEGRQEAVTLQNKIKRHYELCNAIKAVIETGKQLDEEIREQERQELVDVLMTSEDGRKELIELGLLDPPVTD